jgi:hypothetical protein
VHELFAEIVTARTRQLPLRRLRIRPVRCE